MFSLLVQLIIKLFLQKAEEKRRFELFMRIPTEVWTDVLKMLPRCILVTQVAPVCYRFKEISNKNIKAVHVIEKVRQFTDKLEAGDPEGIEQLEHLAGNKCKLAGQFRLMKTKFGISIDEKSTPIFRHCPDLLNGCQILLFINKNNKNSTSFLDCLIQLEKTNPIQINVEQHVNQIIDFWHSRTFQNCSRVDLFYCYEYEVTAATSYDFFVNVLDWLHYQPIGMNCVANNATDQQVRCMIAYLPGHELQHIDWLLDHCSQDIQQAKEVTDRRPFILSFLCLDSDWPGFGQFRQIENKVTGEVLLLERVMGSDVDEPNICCFRLRRCLAEEVANGPEFYARLFDHDRGAGEDLFRIDRLKTPYVTIE